MSERIGLFGGSFDPVHKGHISIVKHAVNELNLDRVIIIPASDPPHKDALCVTDAGVREDLLKEAFPESAFPYATISPYEIEAGGISYSYRTVSHFREIYPDAKLFFIIGYDSLETFDTWREPTLIASQCDLVIADRGDANRQSAHMLSERIRIKYGCGVHFLNMKKVDISSTDIRQSLSGDMKLASHSLPANVFCAIYSEGIYGVGDSRYRIPDKYMEVTRKLKKSLKHSRYLHTMGVAYMCAVMAHRWDTDMEDAILAGLLHDCAKCNSDERNIELMRKDGINITDDELKAPQLLHSKAGVIVARDEYGIRDDNILNAIRLHTTGAPGMNLLEKIVFVADYIEPGRYKVKNLSQIRKLAFVDIDICVYEILKNTLRFLKKSGSYIDEAAIGAYEFYSHQKQ